MRKRIMVLAMIMPIMLILGCGQTIEEATETVENESSLSDEMLDSLAEENLEEDSYYVLHKDGTVEELAFGAASFNQGEADEGVDETKVMWFTDDITDVPTLVDGDALIYYSTEELSEEFIFERFKDLGYSIGIKGITLSPSGRLKISTSMDDGNTYPGGDTDALIQYDNNYVILDALGDAYLRVDPDEDENQEYDEDGNPVVYEDALLSSAGTINGLTKGNYYKALVYAGTVKDEYTFQANVRIFNVMEELTRNEFSFANNTVIQIDIPNYFNSGYYMINGAGLFRYVSTEDTASISLNATDDDDKYANIEFNEANEYPESVEAIESTSSSAMTPSEVEDLENSDEIVEIGEITSNFTVEEPGYLTVDVTFSVANPESDGLEDCTAIIMFPSGERNLQMKESEDGLTLSFNASETGVYTVKYYNLDARTPNMTITTDSEDAE